MRNISVFTATRAEYGLLLNLINQINRDDQTNLNLFVGGTHLIDEFGLTKTQILKDNIKITAEIDFYKGSNDESEILESFASAIIGVSNALSQNKTDILVLLGDRYEALAAAQAASIMRIPIAHIHGGEVTVGALDDSFRNAITKLSHIHFTSTKEYRYRVIQMGENPDSVFNFGAPGVENINKLNLLNKQELSDSLGLDLDKYFVMTYHPETLAEESDTRVINNIFAALDSFDDHQIVITYPNADHGGEKLIEAINNYQKSNSSRVFPFKSLGQLNYLSLLKHARGIIGNSSSGIIEAPALGVPVLNIGDRQMGRIHPRLVFNSSSKIQEIVKNIIYITSKDFITRSIESVNPYDGGETSIKIFNILKEYSLDGILRKRFYDLN